MPLGGLERRTSFGKTARSSRCERRRAISNGGGGGAALNLYITSGGESRAKFQIFKDQSGEYRWRLRADNNEIIADSAEGYVKKSDCEHGVELVKQKAPEAQVENQT